MKTILTWRDTRTAQLMEMIIMMVYPYVGDKILSLERKTRARE